MPTEELLTIEKLVYGGEGLARVDGRVVLTPYVLPGEVVQVATERFKNDLFRGQLKQVISPAAIRVAPPCPYYLRCGGCHYQHIGYDAQVEQKRAILREVLRRVGKIEFEGEIGTIAGGQWGYRNRVQLHIDAGHVGYFEHGSHDLCPVDHCPIASPALSAVIAKLYGHLPGATASVELFTNEIDVQINVADRVPSAAWRFLQSMGTIEPIEYDGFRVSRNSFFQVNRYLIDELVRCALGTARGTWAVDLYAGVGLFSARLAERYERVTAVESHRIAFRDLAHNIELRALKVTAENKTTAEYLAGLEQTPDLILADPPRSGLGKEVVRELVRLRAARLTIVACDPATLARDLQGLLVSGYRIDEITLVDLFPQTFHIEAIVQLSRSN